MTEAQIQSRILKHLRKKYPTALVWKLTEETLCGIPDICFIHEGNVMFFEVKKPGGRVRPLQRSIIKKLEYNDIIAEVVTSVEDVKEIIRDYSLDIT